MEIDKLQNILKKSEGDWISEFEMAAEVFFIENGNNAVAPLIMLMGDNLPNDLNFSIIHIVERTEIHAYTQAILDLTTNPDNLENFWMDVIHFRIFNSDRYLQSYMRALQEACASKKKSAYEYFHRLSLNPKNIKFSKQLNDLKIASTT